LYEKFRSGLPKVRCGYLSASPFQVKGGAPPYAHIYL
jgi:hypothetical protein